MSFPEIADLAKVAGGALLTFLAPRAWDFVKSLITGSIEGQTSITLADRQNDAADKAELRRQVNHLIQEWQVVVVQSKEGEAQLAIQKYITRDLEKKLEQSEAREKAKDELIARLKKRGVIPDDEDYGQ